MIIFYIIGMVVTFSIIVDKLRKKEQKTIEFIGQLYDTGISGEFILVLAAMVLSLVWPIVLPPFLIVQIYKNMKKVT